jgi:hypothetical protein
VPLLFEAALLPAPDRLRPNAPLMPTGHSRRSPLSHTCHASSTPLRPDVFDSTGKPWCFRRTTVPYERRRLYRELAPVSRGAVAFAAPPCRMSAAVYAPVRPRRALPRTASRAPVTSSPRGTRAALGRAGPGHGPRTLRRPSRARLGRVRATQAGCADIVPLGCGRIRPSGI